MFHFVQVTSGGIWDEVRETYPEFVKPRPPRFLVRSTVDANWCVDRNKSVEVEPGLVVSFDDVDDAAYFLSGHHPRKEQPRAIPVHVEAGEVVAFANLDDATYAVRKWGALALTEAQVMAMMSPQEPGPLADLGGDAGFEETRTPAETAGVMEAPPKPARKGARRR